MSSCRANREESIYSYALFICVRTAVFVLLLSLALSLQLHAQSASVSGTITDSTGAVAPNAQVTARNSLTNLAANYDQRLNQAHTHYQPGGSVHTRLRRRKTDSRLIVCRAWT